MGGPIALVRDGDHITIDAVNKTIDVALSAEELAERKKSWTPPEPRYKRGVLFRYARVRRAVVRHALAHSSFADLTNVSGYRRTSRAPRSVLTRTEEAECGWKCSVVAPQQKDGHVCIALKNAQLWKNRLQSG